MWETILALGNALPTAIVGAIATGAFRNLTGWFQNFLDPEVDKEYQKTLLIKTMTKYFAGVTGVTLLAVALGVPVPTEAIAGGVLTADIVASSLRKK